MRTLTTFCFIKVIQMSHLKVCQKMIPILNWAIHMCDNCVFVWLSSKRMEPKIFTFQWTQISATIVQHCGHHSLPGGMHNVALTWCVLSIFLLFVCVCDIWFKAVLKNIDLKRLNEWCTKSENIIVQPLCLCSSALAYLFIIGKWQNQVRIYRAAQTEYIVLFFSFIQ